MRYSIGIFNQSRIVEYDLSAPEMYFLDFLVGFILSDQMRTIATENDKYFWVSYKKAIDEFPFIFSRHTTSKERMIERVTLAVNGLIKKKILSKCTLYADGVFSFFKPDIKILKALINPERDTRENGLKATWEKLENILKNPIADEFYSDEKWERKILKTGIALKYRKKATLETESLLPIVKNRPMGSEKSTHSIAKKQPNKYPYTINPCTISCDYIKRNSSEETDSKESVPTTFHLETSHSVSHLPIQVMDTHSIDLTDSLQESLELPLCVSRASLACSAPPPPEPNHEKVAHKYLCNVLHRDIMDEIKSVGVWVDELLDCFRPPKKYIAEKREERPVVLFALVVEDLIEEWDVAPADICSALDTIYEKRYGVDPPILKTWNPGYLEGAVSYQNMSKRVCK